MPERGFSLWRAGLVRLALAGCAALACLPVPAAGPGPEAPEQGPAPVIELWPGRGPAALYQVGEIRAFELNQGEGLRGVSWGRYEGPLVEEPQHHRFTTRVELLLPGRAPLRSDGEIIVDAAGELVRGFERSDAAQLDFVRQGDLLILSAGRQREELKFARGTAYMAFGALLHEELMLGLRPLRVGEASWRLVSLSGALPTEWSAQISRDPETGAVRLVTSLGESISFAGGRILSIDVEDDGLRVRPSEASWPEWQIAGPRRLSYTPAADASFTRRTIELPGRPGEPRLVGELLIPKKAAEGPRPGVILLAGNGRQDRYGFAGPPPVDLGAYGITDAIAEAGFVVLRFDERGQGESEEGPWTYQGQLEDARRALRTLMVQPEVDPGRIGLVGHGESGWRAMQLAGEDRGVAALALLATPGRPYAALLDAQAELDIAAMPPAVRDAARAQHQRLMTALRGGQALPAELAEQSQWLRELLLIEPERLMRGVTCPLWLAHAEKDFEVDPRRDAGALVAMARRQRLRVQEKVYPGLDHLFKPEAGTSTPARYLDPEGPRAVDPAFLAELTRWLTVTLEPPKRPARSTRAR